MTAFETTVKERSLEIIDILTRLTRKMTEGELIQLTAIGRLDVSETEYFDILRRKTAFLFSSCCEIGSILGGGDQQLQKALRDYGLNLGIAFQLLDDILDITSETEHLGKAAGSDLLEGKLTLPLIYLLEKVPSLRGKLETIMFDGEYKAFSRLELRDMLTAHNIIEKIKNQAQDYACLARKSLDVLAESEYRSCLEDVLAFVTERNA